MTDDELTRLGILPELQALFCPRGATFDYGDNQEVFRNDFHFVPSSRNMWMAGDSSAQEVLIARSAMECLAFLSLNTARYKFPELLSLVAIGNRPASTQIGWIRRRYPKRKFTLLFENDVAGAATDIMVAAKLKNRSLQIEWRGTQVTVTYDDRQFAFDENELTLNAVEKAFGLRSRIRARKPIYHTTFLDQIKHDTV